MSKLTKKQIERCPRLSTAITSPMAQAGLKMLVNRAAFLTFLRGLDPGIVRQDAPPAFGEGLKYPFAVHLDANDPSDVRVRSMAGSREIGLSVPGCEVEHAGAVYLPIGMLIRLLRMMKESHVALSVETEDVLTVRGTFSCFQFAMEGYRLHSPLTELEPEKLTLVEPIILRDGIDWTEVAKRYRAGEGFRALSRAIGVPETTIHGRLKKLGVEFNHRRKVSA